MLPKTKKEIKTLVTALEKHYSELHKRFEEDEKYALLDFKDALNLPEDFMEAGTVLPTARELIETGVDHVAPQFRAVEVPRKSAKQRDTQTAQKMSRFYEALLASFETSMKGNPYRMATKHLFTYGMGCLKLVYDPSKTPLKPIREPGESDDAFKARMDDFDDNEAMPDLPFGLNVVHPMEVMPDPWNDPEEFVVQKYTRTIEELKMAWPKFDVTMASPTEMRDKKVEVTEAWDRVHRIVLAGNQAVLPNADEEGFAVHGYGFNGYIVAASDFGLDTSEHRAEDLYVGIIRYLRKMLEAESRGYSITDIVLQATAWPARVAEGDNASQMEPFKPEYGIIKGMPEGVKIRDLTPQTPPELLLAHTEGTRQRIEAAAAPKSVRGVQEPGVGTGFQQQLLLGEARLKYGVIAAVMEKMLTSLCKGGGKILARKVPKALPIQQWGQEDEATSVAPTQAKANNAVRVRVNVSEPEDEIRKHQDVVSRMTAGAMSQLQGIKASNPEVDPAQEFARIVAEKVVLSEGMLSLIAQVSTQRMADSLGLSEILEMLQRQEVTTQGRTPPALDSGETQVAGSRADQAAQRQGDLRETGGLQ